MNPTISVSKGCFVFKNGATRAEKSSKKSKTKKPATITGGLLGKQITDQPFYQVYLKTWSSFMDHIKQLQSENHSKTLEKLVEYVAGAYGDEEERIESNLPTAALLTGINQPDHYEQFKTFSQRCKQKISSSVCVIQSRDCPSVKSAIETMVYAFVETPQEDEEDRDCKRLRRSQCTMKLLSLWYKNNYLKNEKSNSCTIELHTLVVILPDFECFSGEVLQDFILILSSYCSQLPIVLILGVATAVSAVHSSLPYHVSSKIKLKIFKSQAAPFDMNEILEKVLLSPKYAFHLSGKTLNFLTHIFLYYDFSINGFVQGFKYCLMEHFFQGNAYALCTNFSSSLATIKTMNHSDLETIRRLMSFRPYVEGINDCKRVIAILTDDAYLKKKLPRLLRICHIHFTIFRIFIEFLTVLVGDLPKCPLGRYRRELYSICLSKNIMEQPEFKECWKMIAFMSKDEFVTKISKAVTVTAEFLAEEVSSLEWASVCQAKIKYKLEAVKELLSKVEVACMETKLHIKSTEVISSADLKQISRNNLKEKLLQMSKQDKPVSEFTKSVNITLDYILNEIIGNCLPPLSRAPALHELFVFTDITTVRRNIIGAPRAALHMALNNPKFYLQCKCCELETNTHLVPTMPDLSVAYKLHLECGRLINLFDWLQAFRSVVDYSEDEHEQVDPKIQARFTRAVAEMQFLGYIKTSKRKTDHVSRLTW